jgi:hypothetical protein
MSQTYAATGKTAKSGPSQNGYGLSETDTFSWIHGALTDFFVSIKPQKTWSLIADVLGLKEHAAKHRAANHRDYTIEELMVLLRSESGDEILETLMADSEPAWWKALKINLQVSKALAAQAQWQQSVLALDHAPIDQPTRRKLQKVNNADRSLAASCAAQTTAAGVLHQNRDRSLAGAVASSKAQTSRAGARR